MSTDRQKEIVEIAMKHGDRYLMLRLFLLAHWSKVQGLAHAIHDNADAPNWARDEQKAVG